MERREEEWKMREEKLMEELASMKGRLTKLEGKVVGGKRGRSGGSDSGMSDWWSDSEGLKEKRRKKIRSEVRRVSTEREKKERAGSKRRERERDVMKRHRRKLLMIRKGKKWQEEDSFTEWLIVEIGGGKDTQVEIEQTKDCHVFKVWCEGRDARKKILEGKVKWEEE